MPQLTEVGRRVDALRRERDLRWGGLAEQVGVTRQHLARVMKGQADLKLGQWRKLAEALGVDVVTITGAGQWEPATAVAEAEEARSEAGDQLLDFVSHMDRVARTLRTLPGGQLGIPIRRGVLDLVEEAAERAGAKLPIEYYELRRKVNLGLDV